jgi:hypothetical protein
MLLSILSRLKPGDGLLEADAVEPDCVGPDCPKLAAVTRKNKTDKKRKARMRNLSFFEERLRF